ncbi:MAG TPA: hypothetical protein VH186_28235 [Chloroflexia bacterium]|nr:hypothetical protein [Chloroflexia bacterium]
MDLVKQFKRYSQIIPLRLIGGICLAMCLLVGAGGSIAILAFNLTPYFWIVVIGFVVITLAMIVPLCIVMFGPYLRDIDRMVAGEAWVHWQYSEKEWQQHVANRNRKSRKEPLIRLSIAAGLGAALALVGLILGGKSKDGYSLLFAGLVCVGIALLVMLVLWLVDGGATASKASKGEVYISGLGIYQLPGGYLPLFGYNQVTRNVEFIPGTPAKLRFDARFRVKDYNLLGTSYNDDQAIAEITVPEGHEAEAQALVERFDTEIINKLPRAAVN